MTCHVVVQISGRAWRIALGAALGFAVSSVVLLDRALAQTVPDPACKATPEQVAETRRLGVEFFRPGITLEERLALISPNYIQHNPRFKKYGATNKVNDYDAFVGMAKSGQLGGNAAPAPTSTTQPAGNVLALVTVQCDYVTVIHKNYRQDPTEAPGTWYEVFTFDTFRVESGKLTEHWDGAVISPP